jgi:hypothetical protein
MPTTTNRGYSVPSTGSQSGVWGSDDLNPNFTAIDKNLGAVASVALTNSNYSLSSSEYVCGTIKFSGTLSANVTVTFPTVAGWWTIINNCTGSYYIRLSCSSGGLKICPPPGQAIDIGFDGTDAFYRSLPEHIGGYWDYAGASVPLWVSGCSVPPYLLCDSSTYSSVTYPYLYAILGTTTLVDTRGRSRANLNGGTSRITSGGSGIDGDTRFSGGGAQTVALDSSQNGPHTHSINVNTDSGGANHNHSVPGASPGNGQYSGGGGSGPGGTDGTTGNASAYLHTHEIHANTDSSGSGTAHNNQPPTYIGGITMIRAA